MSKTSVAQAVASVLPKKQRALAAHMTEVVTAAILHLCETQGKAVIPGFGAFEIKVRPPRLVRNPQTGQMIERGEVRKLRFRPARATAERINGGKSQQTRSAEHKEPVSAELV